MCVWVFVPCTWQLSTGCNRPLLYCEDEYVRTCTLYVGHQVCSCLHPVRGIVPVSHLFTKLANYSPSQQRRARQPTYPDV